MMSADHGTLIDGGAPVEQLLLDPDNPRLAGDETKRVTNETLVEFLWKNMSVDEVALSIAANGFHSWEPLLVVRAEGTRAKETRYVVVEGNRRLAAVLLLRDAALRQRVKADELPELDAKDRQRLERLPALLFLDRRSLWSYLGFKHVNGTKEWDAFSKAKYIAQVVNDYGESLDNIARRIGDTFSTVKRLYRGYAVLEQAEAQAGFDRADIVRQRFFFSHLYTAVAQPEFQKFLGLRHDGPEVKDPVPKSKLKELAEFMTWLYGRASDDKQPVVQKQAPDLNYLRAVIGRPQALGALRAGYSLAHCYSMTLGDDYRFRESVTVAKEELQKAKGTVTSGYRGEADLLDMMTTIVATAETIVVEMKAAKKPSKR